MYIKVRPIKNLTIEGAWKKKWKKILKFHSCAARLKIVIRYILQIYWNRFRQGKWRPDTRTFIMERRLCLCTL